jgi:two-component system, OmpR family, phosphate regulon sensor histidine kinase PhoR
MKTFSAKQVALYIALFAVFLFLILTVITNFSGKYYILSLSLGAGLLFVAVYYFAIVFLNNFIFQKIKPIYRTIHSINTPGQDFYKALARKDIIAEVRNEVALWAKNKANEIDQLKQLEKYRREFLGNVSHELKTPIFNIQGYVLTLLDGGLEDPAINKLYLERTEKSINRMIMIVEDLEAISRLESGELKLEREDFNITNLTRDVFEMQEMLAEKYDIKLAFKGQHEKPVLVNADKKRITEVINNLVVNSIKYGKRHGKTTVQFEELDDRILIEISDNGIGIAEKDQWRIFERFYRTDKSRSRDQGGTGLGLSIVKHIIEAHEQTISVRSKLGEGSTFSFTLDKARGK